MPGKQRKIRSSLCLTELLYLKLRKTVNRHHEHRYQYLLQLQRAESRETLISWAINICDYIQPSQDKEAYKNQPIEKDAFWFGH